jgi:polygalacturonase
MRRSGLAALAFALGLLLPGAAFGQASTHFPDRICDITRYGARGTRIFLDTVAVQAAIDDCARQGGGTVRVPRGEYLIGPIFLRSNINLHLNAYAELVATGDEEPYKASAATRAYVTNGAWMALINIADVENVAVTGPGRIDGQGAVWWERWRSRARETRNGGSTNRPRLIQAARSRNLLFDGIGLYNSPSFHLVVKECDGVTVNAMRFVALAHSPNTDAIDPIDTRNMVISDNDFDVGDDVVAVKSMRPDPAGRAAAVENIVIRGNRIRAGRGISIGSETVGGVRHVLVENNVFTGSMYGIRIKTPRERGGIVEDIIFRNNRMTDVETPIVFSGYYASAGYDEAAVAERLRREGGFLLGHQIYPADADAPRPYLPNATPWIRNVRVERLRATGADRAGIVVGLPERSITGLVFRDVTIESRRGLLIRHAEVDASGLRIRAAEGPRIIAERGAQLRVAGPR